MKTKKYFYFILFLFLIYSCSHRPISPSLSLTTATSGLIKGNSASFPIYLTDTLINRVELENKYSPDVFIIHSGHILKPDLSKAENEKTLETLPSKGINLVNLTLEDFAIAELQEIHFENYKQEFLNSTVIDLNLDDLITNPNIYSYKQYNGVTFIGLSDHKISPNLTKRKYIVDDYVLSILKVKKKVLQSKNSHPIQSFIIIHNIGSKIDEVMTRLPPSFINSLAN